MSDLQALVDSLAAELGRPVGVDDRRFRAVAYSSHPDRVDSVRVASILHREAPPQVRSWLGTLAIAAAEGAVRVPANPELGMSARVCVPLRYDAALLGFLWLIDEPERLGEADLERALAYSDVLAVGLHRARRSDSDQREHEAVACLLGLEEGGPAGAEASLAEAPLYAVAALTARGAGGEPVGESPRAHLADAADQLRREANPGEVLIDVAARPLLCLLACAGEEELRRRGAALAGAAARSLAGEGAWRPLVGVSDGSPERAGLARAAARAREALRIGQAVELPGPVFAWGDLGANRIVAAALGAGDPQSLVPASLRKLLEAADAETLVPTLERYLDLAGDARAAAAALYLHRSSLYGRLRRIEAIAEVDLRSGEDRLELHTGLRLWRLGGFAPRLGSPDSGRP